MAKCIMSAFADEYSKDFDVQLKMLSDNSIGYIEPRFVGEKNIADVNSEEAKELKRKMDAYGIKVSSVGSPLGKIKLSDDFAAHLEKCRRVFETANIMETKNVRMFSFYAAEGKKIADCRDEVVNKLGEMIALADSFGVVLCHENEGEIYGESPEACLDLLNEFGGKLRCVFDMGNFVLGGYDPVPAFELLCDYVEYFHIKDSFYAGAIVPPGCGEAHIEDILKRAVSKYGRDYFVTLEPHLELFNGMRKLTNRTFDNPYKFETSEIAFLTAVEKLKEIIK